MYNGVSGWLFTICIIKSVKWQDFERIWTFKCPTCQFLIINNLLIYAPIALYLIVDKKKIKVSEVLWDIFNVQEYSIWVYTMMLFLYEKYRELKTTSLTD